MSFIDDNTPQTPHDPPPPEPPVFTQAENAILAAAAMSDRDWRASWSAIAAETGYGVADQEAAAKEAEKEATALRKQGRYDQAMETMIAAQLGPKVSIPPQPSYSAMTPRMQAEFLRRGMEKQRQPK